MSRWCLAIGQEQILRHSPPPKRVWVELRRGPECPRYTNPRFGAKQLSLTGIRKSVVALTPNVGLVGSCRENQVLRARAPAPHEGGGADRDRTGGLLVANQALSQLSYSPMNPAISNCKVLNADLVGLGRVELPTSPLSGVRSSHLSYRPVFPSYSPGAQDYELSIPHSAVSIQPVWLIAKC